MDKYFANRLLDIAHSRFRPRVALCYKNVYDQMIQNSITDIVQLSDSVYEVIELLKGVGKLEFLVDTDIGTCSCIKGSSGTACKHQAAVVKKFNISICTIPPFFSKEERRMFAILATGEAMGVDFYADLTDATCTINNKSKTECPKLSQPPLQDLDDSYVDLTSQPDDLGNDTINHLEGPWEDQLKIFRDSLDEVVDDMISRLQDGDHNMISGVTKFISAYRK